MILISFMFCIPDLRYAMDMTHKGHGYVAVNNSFSAQILTISVGLGLPTMFYALNNHHMCPIPSNLMVCEAALFLGIGAFLYIGICLITAMIRKENTCKLDDLRGKILLVATILLIFIFVVISLRRT